MRLWCHTPQMGEFFAVPWNDYVAVGTTDTQIEQTLEEPIALEEEISFILENAGAYMTTPPLAQSKKCFLRIKTTRRTRRQRQCNQRNFTSP